MIEIYKMKNGVDVEVAFSDSNKYMRISNIATDSGKQASDWLRLKSTKDYIEALETSLCSQTGNSPFDNITGKLVIARKGGRDAGTWIHPKLIVEFARWVESEFAIWCNDIIESVMSGETVSLENTRPIPKSYVETLEALIVAEKEKERLAFLNEEQQQVIKHQEPKVKYADAVKGSDAGISIRD